MTSYNYCGVFMLMLIVTSIVVWHRVFNWKPVFFDQKRQENVPLQLTTTEMMYILGIDGTLPSVINSNKYLQYVASHIHTPDKSKPHGFRLLDPGTLKIGDTIQKVLGGRRDGFFIECGAYDGFYSHTQFLELNMSWTGLLVEANQRFVRELMKLNRKAFVFGGCLTPYHPKQVQFLAGGGHGFSEELKTEYFHQMLRRHNHVGDSDYLVQCFPLNHLLASIGVNHVDFFSLDIQGGEPKILEAIDYNALRIDVILVEVEHVDANEKEILRNNMRALFNKTGLYDEVVTLDNDMFFQRKDLQKISIES